MAKDENDENDENDEALALAACEREYQRPRGAGRVGDRGNVQAKQPPLAHCMQAPDNRAIAEEEVVEEGVLHFF